MQDAANGIERWIYCRRAKNVGSLVHIVKALRSLLRFKVASSLVENFGATALTVLSGYGIGPDTAARILRNMVDEDGDGLYKQIYDAERQYVMTRGFWDD